MPKVTKKATKKASPLLNEEEKDTNEVVKTDDTADNADTSVEEKTDKSIPVKEENKRNAPVDAPVGSKANVAAEMKSDKEVTRAALMKEEQVHFMIPLALGEKAGAFEDVWINGFHTRVPKGVMSIIPQSIAEILANKYQVEATAGAEFRLDLNPDKQDKVS